MCHNRHERCATTRLLFMLSEKNHSQKNWLHLHEWIHPFSPCCVQITDKTQLRGERQINEGCTAPWQGSVAAIECSSWSRCSLQEAKRAWGWGGGGRGAGQLPVCCSESLSPQRPSKGYTTFQKVAPVGDHKLKHEPMEDNLHLKHYSDTKQPKSQRQRAE